MRSTGFTRTPPHTWVDKQHLASEFSTASSGTSMAQASEARCASPIPMRVPTPGRCSPSSQSVPSSGAPSYREKIGEIARLVRLPRGGCFCDHCRCDRSAESGLGFDRGPAAVDCRPLRSAQRQAGVRAQLPAAKHDRFRGPRPLGVDRRRDRRTDLRVRRTVREQEDRKEGRNRVLRERREHPIDPGIPKPAGQRSPAPHLRCGARCADRSSDRGRPIPPERPLSELWKHPFW